MKNPEIRFIDDNIDWETKQLKEVSVPLKSGTLTQDKLSPDGKYPVVNGGVSYYGYYDNYNNENAFTISARGENAGFCRFNKDKFWAGGLCYPYRGKGLFDTHFISILLNKYEKEIKENYVIRTSIPAVNKSDIEHFNMKFPSISVQKEISSLLSDIDQKISTQEILIQKLKDTKSALLIKMFPQKNQSVPELRFDSFTNDWEQCKLNDIVKSIDTGKSRFKSNNSNGTYAILGSTSIIGYDNNYDYEGDFILTARVGANAGSLYRHTGKVKISDNVVFIQANENINFIFYLLTNFDIKQLSFGTGQPLVKASELKNLYLKIPTNFAEQQKIGAFFNNFDNLITLHQHKSFHLNFSL